MGVERALELFSLKNIGIISYYIYYRLAMFISATELILSRGFFDPSFYERSVRTMVSALRYRAEWVLGLSPIKPEVGGINQMNYYDLFKYPQNDRSGSSAGPRSEESRVGNGCVRTCRSGWSPTTSTKNNRKKKK